MHYGADFIHLISIYILVLIAPGLDFAVIMRESLLYGRENGIAAVFGVMAAVTVHCAYTILGLGVIIAKSLLLFNIIKWAGIAYLLYIGSKALLTKVERGAAISAVMPAAQRGRPFKKAFMAGFACNMLNPKCILFFLSIFSVLIAPSTPMSVKAAEGLTMVLCCGLWFSCVVFFLTVPKITQIYRRLGLWIDKATGAVFIILGISLMFQKAQS